MNLRCLSTFLLAILLCACSSLPKPAEQTVSPTSQGETALDYAAQFGNLNNDTQKRELQQMSQASKTSLEARIKLATIYALPSSKLRDNAKAQNLLDELLKEKSLQPSQKNLLMLLRDFVADASKATSKLRDEQKRADAAQSKADSLQQKLEELKNIEKAMITRDQANPK